MLADPQTSLLFVEQSDGSWSLGLFKDFGY
jgi:hypothetical protein